jgi:hypothetical protein
VGERLGDGWHEPRKLRIVPISQRVRDIVGPEWTEVEAHCVNDGSSRHQAVEILRSRPSGYGFRNPCDGMRNARLKREEAFSHAMIIVSSAMVSSS